MKIVYLIIDATGYPIDAFESVEDAKQRMDAHNALLCTKDWHWRLIALFVNPKKG